MFSLRIIPAVNGWIMVYNEGEPFVFEHITALTDRIEALMDDHSIIQNWRKSTVNPYFYSSSLKSHCRRGRQEDKRSENELLIKPVLNGFIVVVGCKSVVFADLKTLVEDIKSFFVDPDATKRRFMQQSVNSGLFKPYEEEVEGRTDP